VFKPPQRINEKYEKPKSRYPSKILSAKAIRKFAEEAQIPLVAERNDKTETYFSRSRKPVVTTFFDVEFTRADVGTDPTLHQNQGKVKLTNYYLNRIRRVASRPELKSKLLFAVADLQRNMWKLRQIEGIDVDDIKIITTIESGENTYVMADDFSVETIGSFVTEFLDGKLVAANEIVADSYLDDHDEM